MCSRAWQETHLSLHDTMMSLVTCVCVRLSCGSSLVTQLACLLVFFSLSWARQSPSTPPRLAQTLLRCTHSPSQHTLAFSAHTRLLSTHLLQSMVQPFLVCARECVCVCARTAAHPIGACFCSFAASKHLACSKYADDSRATGYANLRALRSTQRTSTATTPTSLGSSQAATIQTNLGNSQVALAPPSR
jgi:hypothetical protein